MKDFEYKFSDKYKEIAGMQVTQIKDNQDFYLEMSASEYKVIEHYIQSPKRVLELGCGLGRFSIFLNSQLDTGPEFFLADYSKISERVKYGWNPADSFYNNLDLTKEFCNLNGLSNLSIIDLEKESVSSLSDIDLVMSFLSVGFHYPIEQYMDHLLDITTDDATFIFGIRKGKYNEDSFSDSFKSSIVIENSSVYTKEEILILQK